MKPIILRGKEGQGQGQSKKNYPEVRLQNGLVFLAINPEESLVQNLIEPDPNDPTFAALCHEVEVAMGLKIENNPENKNPSYSFDTSFDPSFDNKSQRQGERSQSSEDVMTVVLQGQGQEQHTPRAQKIIQVNGESGLKTLVFSPEESPEKKKRRRNAEKNRVEGTITPVKETESEVGLVAKSGEGVEDKGEAYSPPVNKTIILNNTRKSEPDIQIMSDESDDFELSIFCESVIFNDVTVKGLVFEPKKEMEQKKLKNLKVLTLNEHSVVSEVTVTSRRVGRVSLAEGTIDTASVLSTSAVQNQIKKFEEKKSSLTVKQREGGPINIYSEGDEVGSEIAESSEKSATEHSPTRVELVSEARQGIYNEPKPTSHVPGRPSGSGRSRSKNMNLKIIDNMKAEMAKPYPDMMLIKDLMKNTFGFRRKMVQTETSICKIWKTYPAMKYSAVIRQEYFDVCKKNIEELSGELDPVLDNLLDNKLGCLQTLSPLLREAATELDSRELLVGSFNLMKLRRNVGMLAFCTKHTGPLLQGIILSHESHLHNPTEEMQCLAPCIVLKEGSLVGVDGVTSMDIYVERVKVGSTESFYEAVLSLYMLYYIFWMEYQENSKPLFEKFDQLLNESESNSKSMFEIRPPSSGAKYVR